MTNTREKIQAKVDEIGQEVLSAFIKDEQPKLMAEMAEMGFPSSPSRTMPKRRACRSSCPPDSFGSSASCATSRRPGGT